MPEKLSISDTCLERLEAWFKAHVASALKDPDFVSGVLFIVNDEIETVIARERRRAAARLRRPSPQ
jgi:hypothetical protein